LEYFERPEFLAKYCPLLKGSKPLGEDIYLAIEIKRPFYNIFPGVIGNILRVLIAKLAGCNRCADFTGCDPRFCPLKGFIEFMDTEHTEP
jgi:hypothetical protein